jgi:hypothetical protein
MFPGIPRCFCPYITDHPDKSYRYNKSTIVHNQVDASKLNKKSSKCVKTKSDKEDIIVNQKTRISNLENEIKQLKKVIDTYTRTGPNAATTRENTDGVQLHIQNLSAV